MAHSRLPPFPALRAVPALSAPLKARAVALVPVTTTDLPLLRSLYAGSRMAELLLAPWPAEQKRAFLDQQFALQHAHFVDVHRKGDFRIVRQAGAPVGRFYFDRSGSEWVVVDILIGAEAQGNGLGGALIGWLQQAAADSGARGVRLSVAHNNPRAHALYLRLGFVDTGDIAGTHMRMAWRP